MGGGTSSSCSSSPPKFLYYIPGASLILAGVALMLAALLGANLGYSPGIHSSILGGMLTILGYNLAVAGLTTDVHLATILGKPTSKLTAAILHRFNAEKAMLTGAFLAAAGLAYLFLLFTRWVESGYLPLRGENVIALTMLTLGVQTALQALALHLLAKHYFGRSNGA
ncbi:MAG: hypothetical protein ABWK01_01785 [Infirmifilum sp.]